MLEDFLGLFRSETDIVTLQPGQVLFEKGEAGRHMYVIQSGEVQILDGNHNFEKRVSGWNCGRNGVDQRKSQECHRPSYQ